MVLHKPITIYTSGSYETGWRAYIALSDSYLGVREHRTGPKTRNGQAILGLIRLLRNAGFTGQFNVLDQSENFVIGLSGKDASPGLIGPG